MVDNKKRNQRIAERRKKRTKQMVYERKMRLLEKQLSIVENTVEGQIKKVFSDQNLDLKLINSFELIDKSELDAHNEKQCLIC